MNIIALHAHWINLTAIVLFHLSVDKITNTMCVMNVENVSLYSILNCTEWSVLKDKE